ncbi:hemolysin III family protein [Fusobacterium sp.]|uniref:PAQR family membrane homeostasis protein TrhA n=1 Tax=Fusobacterium sp. TaxID=68766 RepID=UPI001D5AFC5D|nr:hemolysin III family protein [Fusobacterium sp.]MBS5789662.1 hemolysin III family protein [Fusobacterium sp.]
MDYKELEERLNFITHYIGTGMAIAGCVALIVHAVRTGRVDYIVGSGIFGGALILMYSMSGTYHILQEGKIKNIFKILDHSAIYILISASYTPYILTVLTGTGRWILFAFQWGLTILGILFKIKFVGRFQLLSTIIYVIMGWIVVFVFKDLKLNLNSISLNLLVCGGVVYTVGAIFYSLKNIKFTHAIWHLFVIGGSVLNYLSIYNIVSV